MNSSCFIRLQLPNCVPRIWACRPKLVSKCSLATASRAASPGKARQQCCFRIKRFKLSQSSHCSALTRHQERRSCKIWG